MAFNSPGEPFSVPDPLAGDWDDMVRRNRLLQAQNDPLSFGDAGPLQPPPDPVQDALNDDSLRLSDWMTLRAQQLAGDVATPNGEAQPFGLTMPADGAAKSGALAAPRAGPMAGRPTLSPGQVGSGRQADVDADIAGARPIVSAVGAIQRIFTPEGTVKDPGPGLLYREWETGQGGPETQDFAPDSRFSREFVQAPSVQSHVRRAIGAWKARPGGWEAQGGAYTHGGASFGPGDYVADALAGNAAAHVIGSFDLNGVKTGDQIAWTAGNKMGRHSYFLGHILDKHGLPGVPDVSLPAPRGSRWQNIHFVTDLDGKPLNDD
jgi:hypothetical protein